MALSSLAIPLWIGASVLIISGVVKMRDPRLAAAAIRRFGIDRRATLVVRGVALVEIVVGVLCFIPQTSIVGAVTAAVAYAAFAIVAAVLLVTGSRLSCGCLGSGSAQVTPAHVAINALLALTSAGAALLGHDVTGVTVSAGIIAAVAAQVVIGAALTVVIFTDASVLAARRRARRETVGRSAGSRSDQPLQLTYVRSTEVLP